MSDEQGTRNPSATYARTLNLETLPEIFEAVPGKCYWRGDPLDRVRVVCVG